MKTIVDTMGCGLLKGSSAPACLNDNAGFSFGINGMTQTEYLVLVDKEGNYVVSVVYHGFIDAEEAHDFAEAMAHFDMMSDIEPVSEALH